MSKLNVVKEFPASDRTDYVRFDRFDKRAKSVAGRYATYMEVLEIAESADGSKNPEQIKTAIRKLETLLVWVDDLQKDIAACRADQKFFEPAEAHDENWEATRAEITRQVVALLDSFPTSNITNPRVYAQTLIEEIRAAAVGGIPLEGACREIRRTMKAPPPIASFLSALAEQMKIWGDRWGAIYDEDDLASHARKLLEELVEQAQGIDQQQEQRAEEWHRVLASGPRVKHAKFGLGTVVEVDGAKLTVEFDMAGRKMVLEDFVERVGENIMNPQSNDAFRRLVGEFSNTGALLESHGEQVDTIAEAMVEVGLRTLIKLAGVNAVANELRNIAQRIERNGETNH